MDATPTPRRKRPRWVKALLVLGLLVLLYLLVGLIFDMSAGRSLRRALAEAEQTGPVRFQELEDRRQFWPAEANGALLVGEVNTRLAEKLEALADKNDLPLIGEANLPPVGHQWPEPTDHAVGQLIETVTPELVQLDRLRDLEGGRFPIVVKSPLQETLLPHLSGLRSCVRIKCIQAIHDARHGRADSLPDHLQTVRKLGQLLEDEPTLISSLVRMACDSMGVHGVQYVLGLATLEAAPLARLDAELTAMDVGDRMQWGLRGERAFFIDTLEWFAKTGDIQGTLNLGIRPILPGLRGWVRHEQAVGVQGLNRLIAAENPRERVDVARRHTQEVIALPRYYLLNRMLMPALESAMSHDLKCTARVRTARAGVAVERYRTDHGAMPTTLAALVPDYLERIPSDPFDGQPLRLRADADRLVIYSVGENEIDDDGDVSAAWGTGQQDADIGFILLPVEHRSQPPAPPTTAAESP